MIDHRLAVVDRIGALVVALFILHAAFRIIRPAIDELVDARQGVHLKRSAMASGHPILESLADQVFSSDRLMRTPVLRESLRRTLKEISKPVVRG